MKLIKKLFTSLAVFLIAFVVISAVTDIYYHKRLTYRKETIKESWICRCDFAVFWTAARNMLYHADRAVDHKKYPVYDKSEKFYHFRYTPFAALVMIPIALTSSTAIALCIWFVLLNTAMLAALLLLVNQLARDFNITRTYQYIILWLTFLVSTRFYFMNLAVGQTDVLIALFFVFFLMAYVRGNELLSGMLFALMLQFKPLFAPALFYFLITGKRKLILSTVVCFAGFLFTPSLVVGFDKTLLLLKEWVATVGTSVSSQLLSCKNQSITYFIGDMLLRHAALGKFISVKYLFYLLGSGLTLAAYIAASWLKKPADRQEAKKYKYVEVSVLIMVSLLFSPIAWVAPFINLIIPFSVALLFTLNCKKNRALCAALLGAFFVFSCLAGTDFTNFIPVVNKIHFINIAFGVILLAFALIFSYKDSAV